ncbi:MAG: thermonuclease family protein [Xanthobacteraceae bacterium]
MKLFPVLIFLAVTSVKDGDTLGGHIENCRPAFLCETSIRLDGGDTPEKRKPAPDCEIKRGLAASEFAQGLVHPGERVIVKVLGADKYGNRWLGRVQLADGRDMMQVMIEAGHAREYHGERKEPWCTDP